MVKLNNLSRQLPDRLYHYTASLTQIAKKGYLRAPVSLSEVLSAQFAGQICRQAVVGYTALEFPAAALQVEAHDYDPHDSGLGHEVINSWIDEREWVSKATVQLSDAVKAYVNRRLAGYACEYLSKATFKRYLKTEVGRAAAIWLKVDSANDPRPSLAESTEFLIRYYTDVTGLPVGVMPD